MPALLRAGLKHFYFLIFFVKGGFLGFFMYCIQHCFICRLSDSTVSEDAGIEPSTVATLALAARRSNHSARSHPLLTLQFSCAGCSAPTLSFHPIHSTFKNSERANRLGLFHVSGKYPCNPMHTPRHHPHALYSKIYT